MTEQTKTPEEIQEALDALEQAYEYYTQEALPENDQPYYDDLPFAA
ncbi:hypothetical protein Q4555_13865 [Octadecabacter sp. 1_MG-2023]|nr:MULTISPECIES: hypothetical protein [unclassified Octadecabacter]MBU2991786.1 hypothetical protein [Octadecabacter sp. B2R22]MDO6735759.1 hypothetical protein [Octadecabacter sp. 1_MG-2023]